MPTGQEPPCDNEAKCRDSHTRNRKRGLPRRPRPDLLTTRSHQAAGDRTNGDTDLPLGAGTGKMPGRRERAISPRITTAARLSTTGHFGPSACAPSSTALEVRHDVGCRWRLGDPRSGAGRVGRSGQRHRVVASTDVLRTESCLCRGAPFPLSVNRRSCLLASRAAEGEQLARWFGPGKEAGRPWPSGVPMCEQRR